jgi:hypothetical protein
MSRLKKIANSNTRNLPNVFAIKNEKIKLNENVVSFIEKNFIQTRRNLGFDEIGQVLIAHYVLDRASIEEYLGAPIDDATCKVILDFLTSETKKTLDDEIVEKLNKEGYECKVYKTSYEYGDGVFHTHCILIEV